MKNIKECEDWLKKSPDNFIELRGWCIKDIERLNSTQSNFHMETVKIDDDWKMRSNSFRKEIEEYPEEAKLRHFNEGHDTSYTDEPICPYCGKEVRDAWEISSNETDFECGFCERTFELVRHVSVSYSTY